MQKIGTLFFVFFLAGLLTKPGPARYYASLGLDLWFHQMIPALLPFLILSGIWIRTKTASVFSGRSPRFAVVWTIFSGFFWGFPMGAKTTAELYERRILTKKQAKWLLSFCNQVSPAYVIGVFFPMTGIERKILCLLLLYGIPFVYGILLKLTCYKDMSFKLEYHQKACRGTVPISEAFEQSVGSSMQTILTLGGIMIFFTLFNLFPLLLFGKEKTPFSLLFEITSGIQLCGGKPVSVCLPALSFGGISTLLQTASALKDTDLTELLPMYFLHKLIVAGMIFFCLIQSGVVF